MSRAFLVSLALVFVSGFLVGRVSTTAETGSAPQWTVAGELSRARAYARAVAVETGEILVFGGLDAGDPDVTLRTSELFDPEHGTVSVLPQQLVGRLNQAVAVGWGGRVVVTGGTKWTGGGWAAVDDVDVYLPWARTWLHAAPLRQPRADHAAVALADGRILVTGGNYGSRILRASEIYDPARDEWTAAAPLPRPRTMLSLALLPDGSVFAAGGFQDDAMITRTTYIYEPWNDLWVTGPEMREVRLNHSMARLPDGDVLFFGGESMGAGTAERYSWRGRRFEHAGVLGEPRLVAQGATLPDGSVLAVGGLPDDRWRQKFLPTAAAELWDPRDRVWRDISRAPSLRAYAQLVVTERGVFRLSGVGENEEAFTTVEALVWR